MKRLPFSHFLLLLAYLFAFLLIFSCQHTPGRVTLPAVSQVKRFSAVITWQTEHAARGTVIIYKEAGAQVLYEKHLAREHAVSVQSLLPGTLYYYEVDHRPGERYFFRTAPQAGEVFLVGNFNDWREDTHPMKLNKGGRWTKAVYLLPGTYEYKFLVDGEWQTDMSNTRKGRNLYGTRNSLITVEPA